MITRCDSSLASLSGQYEESSSIDVGDVVFGDDSACLLEFEELHEIETFIG